MDQIQSSPQIPVPPPPIAVAPEKKSSLINIIILIFSLVIILSIISAAIFFIFNQYYSSKNSGPGNGSVFNTPSEEFQAVIDKVDGNTLLVSYQKASLTSPGNTEEYLFKILINEETTILSERDTAPLENSATSSADNKAVYSISDLSPGQFITVITAGDLRGITSDTITAKSIIISPGLTIFIGKIEEVKSGELVVTSGPPSVAEEKTYTISVTKNTEIVNSRIMNDSSPEADKKLSLKDLTTGATILVNTVGDINKVTKTPALRIELIRGF